MSENDRRRFDHLALRSTRLMVLNIVGQNPNIPFVNLSEQFEETILRLKKEGVSMELPFGPGQPFKDLEHFVEQMSGRRDGLLERTGLDGTSTFQLAYQGKRALELNHLLSKPKATPQY